MAETFDLVVIGAGPGGYVAAIRAAQLGLKTACIEKEPALGGTCLRIGCIPSKALLESSHRFHELDEGLHEHGISVGKPKLDLAAMMRRKDGIVKGLTDGVEFLFRKNKITSITGTARFTAPRKIIVSSSGEETEVEADRVIIATGSTPAIPEGLEPDGRFIGTSTDALSYARVPKRLAVIGGGYIGLELGSVWSRLGSSVTVLEYLPHILPGLDAEIAGEARKIFERQGLHFRLNARIRKIRPENTHCVIESEGQEDLPADRVLVAVGRRPNTDGLNLEAAGVETGARGFISVDEHFQTSAAGVYAIGDVIGGAMLAHKAEDEGVACVERMVNGYGHVNYLAIPAIVYTEPEIAAVGRTEEQLKEEGIPYNKGVFPFKPNGRARCLGNTDGRVKILADAATDRILGAHIIGPRAGDLIAELAAAMEFSASSEDVARTSHAHPTLSEVVREAAMAVEGMPIHM